MPLENSHLANLPTSIELGAAPLSIQPATIGAAAGGDKPSKRSFDMVGYSGGLLSLGWRHPVVVNLANMDVPSQQMPILLQHGYLSFGSNILDAVLGQTTEIAKGNDLRATGQILGNSQFARQAIALNDEGFNFQASIGADVLKIEFVDEGTETTVNGQTFVGPLYVVSASRLREISFVVMGADHQTNARIAAAFAAHQKESNMPAPSTPTATPTAPQNGGQANAQAPESIPPTFNITDVQAAATTASRDAVFAAARQVAEIERLAASHPEIRAKALAEQWTADKVELEVMRAERGSGSAPAVIARGGAAVDDTMVEASLMIATRAMPEQAIVAKYGEKTVDASNRMYSGSFGLQRAVLVAANRAGGEHFDHISLQNGQRVLQAAFSSGSLPNVLGAVANKILVSAFNSGDQSWREVFGTINATDFKTHTGVRLAANGKFEKVGPGGQVTEGSFEEAAYTVKPDLYAKLFTLPLQLILNDDAGAFANLPSDIGLGAIQALSSECWSKFMNNASFFTAGRGNFDDGSDSALGVDGLTAAEVLLNNLTMENGEPLALSTPVVLLVPTALGALARQIFKSEKILGSSGADANPHSGSFMPVVCPYLHVSTITGYSAKKWYLVRKPMGSLAVAHVAFVGGQQTPTISSVELSADRIGIGFRGMWGFAAALAEYRMGVAMKGEA